VHLLVTEGRHFVVLTTAAGFAVAGVVALVVLANGQRGGHAVAVFVAAVGVVGVLSVFVGTCLDPMGFPGGYLPRDASAAVPRERLKRLRTDDVLYGGGVLLIGLAVLIGYACTWAGVPANPFG
jgi:hypothetical protein